MTEPAIPADAEQPAGPPAAAEGPSAADFAAAVAPTLFYDAVTLANYPHGQPGCFYGDGDFATTPGAVGAIVNPPEARWITVTGNPEVGSIVDGRPDNFLSPGRMRAFVRGRRAINTDAIIYAPRAWVAEWLSVLNDFGHGELGKYGKLFWWIPTLDGRQWTAEELAADLADNWQADVPADRIWGNQWNQLPQLGPGAGTDVSSLFLPWRP